MLVRRATGRYKETGRGNTFIVFPKRGRKEIAVEVVNSRVVRQLQRRLYQKAKQEQSAKAAGRR